MGTKINISGKTDNDRLTDKNMNAYLVKVEDPGKSLNKRPGVWLIIGTEKEKTNDDLHKVNKSDKLYNKDPKVWLFKWTKDQKDQETEQETDQNTDQETDQKNGRKTDPPQYICLQVAKTKDIWKEMREDWGMLDEKKQDETEQESGEKKDWVNQFGEFQFKYSAEGLSRKWLYQHIAVNYENIKFVCVAYGKDDKQSDGFQSLNDKNNRSVLEKYIAYSTFSKFWRNGRPYSKALDDETQSAETGKPQKKRKNKIKDIKVADSNWCIKEKESIKTILGENDKLNRLNGFLEKICVSSE